MLLISIVTREAKSASLRRFIALNYTIHMQEMYCEKDKDVSVLGFILGKFQTVLEGVESHTRDD